MQEHQPPRQPVQGEDYHEVPPTQDPPEGYLEQPPLDPGQAPYIQEREVDLITAAEEEEADASEEDGEAVDGDDSVEFDPPDERPKQP
jgi:hypothetical protein